MSEIITTQQQNELDEIFEADMRLTDVREWRKDREAGHNLSPKEWMQLKSLPEVERNAAKAKKIEEDSVFQEFLNEQFPNNSKIRAYQKSEKDYFQEFLDEQFPNRKK